MDKINQIFFGIDKFSNKIKLLLSKIGNEEIIDIIVCRKPIQKIIKYFLNITSFATVEKNLIKNNYDDIFHLFMIVKTNNNNYILIEKNEILNIILINMDLINNASNIEKLNIEYNNNISINDFLNNTLKKIGTYNFFNYDSRNLNCQKFILDLLNNNNLLKYEYKKFIYQNPLEIYKNTGLLPIFNKQITNLGATYKILKGEGLKKNIKKLKK